MFSTHGKAASMTQHSDRTYSCTVSQTTEDGFTRTTLTQTSPQRSVHSTKTCEEKRLTLGGTRLIFVSLSIYWVAEWPLKETVLTKSSSGWPFTRLAASFMVLQWVTPRAAKRPLEVHNETSKRQELDTRGFHIGDAATKFWRAHQKFVIGLDR